MFYLQIKPWLIAAHMYIFNSSWVWKINCLPALLCCFVALTVSPFWLEAPWRFERSELCGFCCKHTSRKVDESKHFAPRLWREHLLKGRTEGRLWKLSSSLSNGSAVKTHRCITSYSHSEPRARERLKASFVSSSRARASLRCSAVVQLSLRALPFLFCFLTARRRR